MSIFKQSWFKAGIVAAVIVLLVGAIGAGVYVGAQKYNNYLAVKDIEKQLVEARLASTTEEVEALKNDLLKLQGTQAAAPKQTISAPSTSSNSKLTNAQIVAKVKPAVVYIETSQKVGSGMIISSDGYIREGWWFRLGRTAHPL